MKTIDSIKRNTWVIISEIKAGKQLKQKLYSMGIREGDKIFILQDTKNGPLIILKEQIKIALGKGFAKKITVLDIEPTENKQ